MLRLLKKFLEHVLPGVVKPLHALWNEIIGFLFLCLAVIGLFATWRAVAQFQGDLGGVVRIGFTAFFGIVMLGFGVGSFLRARRISRS